MMNRLSEPKLSVAGVTPPTVSVIVPTYREAENLGLLVPRIAAALDAARLDGEIIIVDDDSPDNTARVCGKLALEYPLRLIARKGERGLSSAVVHGLLVALGEVMVVMDADLSHPPEQVTALALAAMGPGVDFVIGSRYVPGGGTDESWGLFRQLNSRVATLFARPFTRAKDPLAGFFALRRDVLARAEALDPIGYKIGLELIVKCHCRNIVEIPIAFQNRQRGESKLNLRQQWNYLVHVTRLLRFRAGEIVGLAAAPSGSTPFAARAVAKAPAKAA